MDEQRFTPAALRFLKDLVVTKQHWFEAQEEEYLTEVVAPTCALIKELDVRIARSAPEITSVERSRRMASTVRANAPRLSCTDCAGRTTFTDEHDEC